MFDWPARMNTFTGPGASAAVAFGVKEKARIPRRIAIRRVVMGKLLSLREDRKSNLIR